MIVSFHSIAVAAGIAVECFFAYCVVDYTGVNNVDDIQGEYKYSSHHLQVLGRMENRDHTPNNLLRNNRPPYYIQTPSQTTSGTPLRQ